MTTRARVLDLAAAVAGLATDLTASALGWLLERRTGGQQVPGAVNTPVPGSAPPAAHGRAPMRPAPAPGPPIPPPPHGHPGGRLRKRIDVLFCGCTYIYDGHDQEWNVITCGAAGIDWDAGLRRLTRD